MRAAAIHLNDARISACAGVDAPATFVEPAFALLGGPKIVVGRAAFAESRRHPRSVKNRFVDGLSVAPLTDRRFSHLSNADLAAELLDEAWRSVSDSADTLIWVVPGSFDQAALGVLAGVSDALEIPLGGIVDSAVAASRREYPGADLVHVEVGLHATLVTEISQGTGLAVGRVERIDAAGLEDLRSTWMQSISDAFIEQSRFDPLHTAESEQQLLDALPAYLAAACEGRPVVLSLEFAGLTHEAELDPLAFANAASGVYQSVANAVRATASAGTRTALQFTDDVAILPGFTDFIAARTGADVYMLDSDAPCHGALARAREILASGGRRRVTTLAADLAAVVTSAGSTENGAAPTHLLHGDLAVALNGEALIIGSGGGSDPQRISLADGMAGVSSRHCSLVTQDGQCVVADHSRYGTFLNDNRISGSAVLQPGDVIRVGTPGVEFRLIRAVSADEA